MNTLNEKLALLQAKIKQEKPVTIMIMGLGSVGLYLFDYLVSLGDPGLHLVVTGRSREKLLTDVNIVRTAAAIRGCLKSKIDIEIVIWKMLDRFVLLLKIFTRFYRE